MKQFEAVDQFITPLEPGVIRRKMQKQTKADPKSQISKS